MSDEEPASFRVLMSPRHLKRIFGESATEAAARGKSLKNSDQDRLDLVLRATLAKVGPDPHPGTISLPLLEQVLESISSDTASISAEYLAGTLVCGRTPENEHRALFILDSVRSLSAAALAGHFVVYKTWVASLRNSPEAANSIFLPLLFIPRAEFAVAVGASGDLDLDQLDAIYLRELRDRRFLNKLSGPAARFKHVFPDLADDGLLLTTTSQGQDLFIAACGSPAMTLPVMVESLIDLELFNLAPRPGARLIPYPVQ